MNRSAIAPPPPVARGLNGEKQKCACPITRLLGRRAVLIAGRPTAGIDRAQGCAILRRDAQLRKWWPFRHGQIQRAARGAEGWRNPQQNGRKRRKTANGSLRPIGEDCRPRRSNPGTPGDQPPPASPIEGRTDHGERTSAANRANVQRPLDAGVAGPRHHNRSAPLAGCDDRRVHAERRSSPINERIVVSYPPTEQTREHRQPDCTRSRPAVHCPWLRPASGQGKPCDSQDRARKDDGFQVR